MFLLTYLIVEIWKRTPSTRDRTRVLWPAEMLTNTPTDLVESLRSEYCILFFQKPQCVWWRGPVGVAANISANIFFGNNFFRPNFFFGQKTLTGNEAPKKILEFFFQNGRLKKTEIFKTDNSQKKIWVIHFEIYFCFIPMKISQSFLASKDGSKFWWLPWNPTIFNIIQCDDGPTERSSCLLMVQCLFW